LAYLVSAVSQVEKVNERVDIALAQGVNANAVLSRRRGRDTARHRGIIGSGRGERHLMLLTAGTTAVVIVVVERERGRVGGARLEVGVEDVESRGDPAAILVVIVAAAVATLALLA